MPNTKFYFSYEEGFNLDGLKVEVEVEQLWSDGKTTTAKVDITKDVVVKGSATPASMYDNTKFKYEVEVVYVGSEYSEIVDAVLGTFTAYIGQKGDIELNHNVRVEDATAITKEFLERDFDGTTLAELVAKAGLEKELEGVGTDFAAFLADVDENGKITVEDATSTTKFFLEKDFADDTFDAHKTWKELIPTIK